MIIGRSLRLIRTCFAALSFVLFLVALAAAWAEAGLFLRQEVGLLAQAVLDAVVAIGGVVILMRWINRNPNHPITRRLGGYFN